MSLDSRIMKMVRQAKGKYGEYSAEANEYDEFDEAEEVEELDDEDGEFSEEDEAFGGADCSGPAGADGLSSTTLTSVNDPLRNLRRLASAKELAFDKIDEEMWKLSKHGIDVHYREHRRADAQAVSALLVGLSGWFDLLSKLDA